MSQGSRLRSDAELEAYLRSLIVASGSHAHSLLDLTLHAQGAYPTEVRRLAKEIAAINANALHPNALRYEFVEPTLQSARSALPLPHPLDFEWRYAEAGWHKLIDEIMSHIFRRGANIALFGTCGFAEVLPDLLPGHRVTLFELRREACHALAARTDLDVIAGDVARTTVGLPRSFHVVVADPPWYPALIEQFVSAAARVLVPGGTLLLCLPGRATRPGIPAELERLLELGQRSGFALDEHHEAAVTYESPPFELAALGAAELKGFDPYWRRSDLLRFRRLPTPPPAAQQRPPSLALPDTWSEVQIGRARFRIDLGRPILAADRLEPIVSGDVLDSVSSRDPRRGAANIWTTTNRIFRTSDPADLFAALQVAARQEPVQAKWIEPVERLVNEELELLSMLGVE